MILYTSALLLVPLLVNVTTAGKGRGPAVGETCVDEYDCGRNQICENSTMKCQCIPGLFEIYDGRCSIVLGDFNYNCNSHCECNAYVPNSRCVGRYVCACKEGYVKQGNTTCVAGPTI